MIGVKTFSPPEWDISEIMRYARIKGTDEVYRGLIDECIKETESVLSYSVCYTVLDIGVSNNETSLGDITVISDTLSRALQGCRHAVMFAATVGSPLDRLINKYSRTQPSKALIMQAIGAERVETLCDSFCTFMNDELSVEKRCLKRRVSPGYGDIDLAMQRDIFAVLDCPRKIGVTLDGSLMMSPSKSVTAIAGISDIVSDDKTDCDTCNKNDCVYSKM